MKQSVPVQVQSVEVYSTDIELLDISLSDRNFLQKTMGQGGIGGILGEVGICSVVL